MRKSKFSESTIVTLLTGPSHERHGWRESISPDRAFICYRCCVLSWVNISPLMALRWVSM